MNDAQFPETGLRCRGCGCQHFYVLKTRRAPKNRVIRTRECRHCGQRLVTYEQAAGQKLPVGLEELSPKQRESLLERMLEMFRFRPL